VSGVPVHGVDRELERAAALILRAAAGRDPESPPRPPARRAPTVAAADADVRALAARILSPEQHEAWALALAGWSTQRIARHLGRGPSTISERLSRAAERLEAAGARRDGSGHWRLGRGA
jgi:DNA-directed RNA polymerase specialized sigma24 family protein